MLSFNSAQLRDLDRSSSEFHVKLANILLGEDCASQVQELSHEDPQRLVEDLDRVCLQSTFIRFLLNIITGSHRS